MSTTGLAVFDNTVQKTNAWINDLAAELGWEDKHRVFQGLRTTLHALARSPNRGRSSPPRCSATYSPEWVLLRKLEACKKSK